MLVLIGLIISISFFEPGPTGKKSDYLAAIIDKHHKAESIHSPKIIFAGGSNLAFGIDSKAIENEFKLPVINMGLHASLGLSFILNELKYTIRQNDIVFLSPEYFIENDGMYDYKKNAAHFYPACRSYFNTNYFIEGKEYVENQQRKFKNIFAEYKQDEKGLAYDSTVYNRKAFNDYGDVINHLDKIKPAALTSYHTLSYTKWKGIPAINKFNEFARSKNVRFFFLYPGYAASEYKKNLAAINGLQVDMAKYLQVAILNSPIEFVYADSLFFDTVYHLNKEGRQKRTLQLMELFKKNTSVQLAFGQAKSGNQHAGNF